MNSARFELVKRSPARPMDPVVRRAPGPLASGSRFRLAAIAPIVMMVALAGCQEVDLVLQSHYRLESAYESLLQGQYLAANELMENLLADVDARKDEFALQRFYAYFLLTQASILQAFKETGESGPATQDVRRLNPRVMTAMYYAGCAVDSLDAARSRPAVSPSNQRLLPGRLEKISPETIKEQLDLFVIAFYASLRFNDKMSICIEKFERFGDLSKLETCEALLDKAQILEELRPWIELALSRYVRHQKPQIAFAFAIRSLHDENSKIDELAREELIAWINDGSDFEFKCYKCNLKVIPDRAACYNCGETYLKAYGVKKEKETP